MSYGGWRRQENLNQSQCVERVAAKVAREVLFYRLGYRATIPSWAYIIAEDRTIPMDKVRAALAEKYNTIADDLIRESLEVKYGN
jgi:hypothetical protein